MRSQIGQELDGVPEERTSGVKASVLMVTPGLLQVFRLEVVIDGSALDVKGTRLITTLVGGF